MSACLHYLINFLSNKYQLLSCLRARANEDKQWIRDQPPIFLGKEQDDEIIDSNEGYIPPWYVGNNLIGINHLHLSYTSIMN